MGWIGALGRQHKQRVFAVWGEGTASAAGSTADSASTLINGDN
jgi:hypothetical protein